MQWNYEKCYSHNFFGIYYDQAQSFFSFCITYYVIYIFFLYWMPWSSSLKWKRRRKTRCFTFHRALIFLFLRSACWRVFPIPNIPYHQQKGSTFIFYVLSYIDEPNTSCRRLEKNWVHRYFNKRARSSTSGFIICPRELLYRKTR